jgi:hypothetical protein
MYHLHHVYWTRLVCGKLFDETDGYEDTIINWVGSKNKSGITGLDESEYKCECIHAPL